MLYQLLVSAVAAQIVCKEEPHVQVCLNKVDGPNGKPLVHINYLNAGPLLQGNTQVNLWYKINDQIATKFDMAIWKDREQTFGRSSTIQVIESPNYNVQVSFFGPQGNWDSKFGQNYKFNF